MSKPGTHRPHVTCALSTVADQRLTELAQQRGVSRAALAREVIETALTPISPGRAWELDAGEDQR